MSRKILAVLALVLALLFGFAVTAYAQDNAPDCSMQKPVTVPPNQFRLNINCPAPSSGENHYRTLFYGDGQQINLLLNADGDVSVTHAYAYVPDGVITYTLGIDWVPGNAVLEDIYTLVIDDRKSTPTEVPPVTQTPEPSTTPTGTVVPTDTATTTPIPTGTGTVTVTVTPQLTATPALVVVIEGNPSDCRQFHDAQLDVNGICFIPQGITVTTNSDIFVSDDRNVYENELHKGGGSFSGGKFVFAKWGASFSPGMPTPTPTATPVVTVTPIPEATPVFVMIGVSAKCQDFEGTLMSPGGSCYVPEGISLSTDSDLYVSNDITITVDELLTGGNHLIAGLKYVYAPWGATFVSTSPRTRDDMKAKTFMPSIAAVEEPVFVFSGQPLNCLDYKDRVAPPGSVCTTDKNLKTNSDVYISADPVFMTEELHTGGNVTAPTGQYIYMPFGASFFSP